jgi:signal transduction histidine kinase
LPHLFEPSVTTKKSATGHGMGLAICRWIVEEMGGSIRCLPDMKRGAVFEVRIPVEPRPTSR